ncbi:hypothetical protein C0995_006198 [Termitomyces sp. Mi166|nr:hypothetical protein C0995_006198 [Termitomyces sp. Mi166\
MDLKYLVYPVKTIVEATNATELRVLIEVYCILTVCLRAVVTGEMDDASWPLFQPLQTHKEALVEAVVRDLGKALVDPAARKEEKEPVKICSLWSMFTAVLAILLTDDLSTPNARKTWALAIWLIQSQPLSAAVLSSATDLIAFALCCGIDGELGKEGKRCSASDGLKAIHGLSVHLPSVFIPAFTNALLPSMLASLLAPSVAIRTHAVHALGEFVIGTTSIPNSPVHAQISNKVLKYIMTLPSPHAMPSPTKRASPTKPSFSPIPQTPTKAQEPSIIRTLHTTLQVTEPAHVTHGSLRCDARPAPEGACPAWNEKQESQYENGEEELDEREMEREVKLRDEWWKVIASVMEMETGVCAIAMMIGSGNVGVPVYEPGQWVDARLSAEEREEQPLRRALEVLCAMAGKEAPTRESAVDTMCVMVGMPLSMRRENVEAREYEKEERMLVLRGAVDDGVWTVKEGVRVLFDETPKVEDVRVLREVEMRKVWVWEGIVRAWRVVVGGKGEEGERERKGLLQVWEGMVRMGLGAALDPGDEDLD